MQSTQLSSEHIDAVNRRRRLINHYDAALYRYGAAPLEATTEAVMEFADWPGPPDRQRLVGRIWRLGMSPKRVRGTLPERA